MLVEKPIARTVAEATAIQEAVQGSDRVVQVGFVRRHSPNCQVLKPFIDAGQLGEMYYAKASLIRRMGNPRGWFADKEIAGGGALHVRRRRCPRGAGRPGSAGRGVGRHRAARRKSPQPLNPPLATLSLNRE